MLFQVEFGNCLSANAKGRFRILKTFSFSSGGRLVFASSRVGCEKRYRETRISCLDKNYRCFGIFSKVAQQFVHKHPS